jgi:hypothetical protein
MEINKLVKEGKIKVDILCPFCDTRISYPDSEDEEKFKEFNNHVLAH